MSYEEINYIDLSLYINPDEFINNWKILEIEESEETEEISDFEEYRQYGHNWPRG